MVSIQLDIPNEDIPAIRRWIADQKEELSDMMIAGQPTRISCDATTAWLLVANISGQLLIHDERVAKLNREEKAARRRE